MLFWYFVQCTSGNKIGKLPSIDLQNRTKITMTNKEDKITYNKITKNVTLTNFTCTDLNSMQTYVVIYVLSTSIQPMKKR
jgi:hypothetical protein